MSGSNKRNFRVVRCVGAMLGLFLGHSVAVPAVSGDWSPSLFSLGLIGYGAHASSAPSAVGLHGSGAAGLVANFEQDFGDIVLGGSFQQGRGVGLSGLGSGDAAQRIDLRAGYDFGHSLGYLTVGEVGQGRGTSEQRSQVYGFGVRISVNRILQMTGEVLHRDGDAAGRDTVLSGDILSVEAAFRF